MRVEAVVTLLAAMGQSLSETSQKHLKDMQQLRNHCYLEHGYQRLRAEDAERLNDYAAAICRELLGEDLDVLRQAVRHSC